MKKRSILSLTAALSLGIGLWAAPAKAPQAANTAAIPAVKQGGPVDFAIANEDKLTEMLKRNGTLRSNATPAEAEQEVRKYLRQKAAHMPRAKGNCTKKRRSAPKCCDKNCGQTAC